MTDNLSNTAKNFTVVYFDEDVNPKLVECSVDNLHQFYLVKQRLAANNVGIALEELAVAPLLWTIGTPYWLNLVALKRERNFVLMLYHVAGKRNGKVVAKPLLANLGAKNVSSIRVKLRSIGTRSKIAGVKNLKEQLIPLLAILTKQGRKVLHCRGFDRLEAISLVNRLNGVENIVALRHFLGRKVSCTFWDAWFLCHFIAVLFLVMQR